MEILSTLAAPSKVSEVWSGSVFLNLFPGMQWKAGTCSFVHPALCSGRNHRDSFPQDVCQTLPRLCDRKTMSHLLGQLIETSFPFSVVATMVKMTEQAEIQVSGSRAVAGVWVGSKIGIADNESE